MNTTDIREQLDDVSSELLKPFPANAIQTRTGTGWQYVQAHTVIHRLIDATGNAYDWIVKSVDYRPYGKTELKSDGSGGNDRTLIIVRGELTIYGLGTRSGVGVQVVTSETGGEDLWKGADADAMKNAAKNFGVALGLYGPDYEAGEVATSIESAPAYSNDSASDKQRDFIKSLQSERNLSNRDMVAMTNGATLDQLTRHQASDLIKKLQAMKS